MEQLLPAMIPRPGERLLRFVGDRVRFSLQDRHGRAPEKNWRALLRTNLGRAQVLRREIIQAHAKGLPLGAASWRDLPMQAETDGWAIEIPVAEVGFFKAKAYFVDPNGWQHWPHGPDVGISVHPDSGRTANTIYCAFTRLFGRTKTALSTRDEKLEQSLKPLDKDGYTVIPPSGKLRELVQHLPHIMNELGCRILHLLPVNPTPTVYARFGRFGSPYAALDLTAIDAALVEFDRRTTGVDQFRELTYAVHCRGGRVLLDIVINHTGWGSVLQENRPEYFLRNTDGTLASPGAWGITWEDLVELKHDSVALWNELAEMFLTWCRRGVDGFRCDAGYKVPVHAWQYIIARTRQEFPETIFLLEGLGGAWEATEALLSGGGMQWAYSELFQNYSGLQVAGYLDHSLKQSERVGLLVHYSETHDNDRLAAQDTSEAGSSKIQDRQRAASSMLHPRSSFVHGRAWSLLRNRLCALTSVSGGFGFTCGVEWLATEKICVHGSTGLAWGRKENIVPELARLNQLLAEHPCFFDGAKLTRLSLVESSACALLRESAEGKDRVLVLVNNDPEQEQTFSTASPDEWRFELLGQDVPEMRRSKTGELLITLPVGAAYCLSLASAPRGLSGDAYRRARAQAAWAVQAMTEDLSVREIGPYDWRALAEVVNRSPGQFLAAIRYLDRQIVGTDVLAALDRALGPKALPHVIRWSLIDRRRITLVPPGHWLLIEDDAPFRASLCSNDGSLPQNVQSIAVAGGHVACFPPRCAAAAPLAGQSADEAPAAPSADATLRLERYAEAEQHVEAALRFLAPAPEISSWKLHPRKSDALALLTNGIGGMARMCVDLGRVKSKYDCVLGANLHPRLPVDRHIFVKRIRVWVNADGFIGPLDATNLASFEPGPPAVWHFVATAGDGRTVEIEMRAEMLEGRNTTVFHFSRPTAAQAAGKQLPPEADVGLTVRLDIEDRNFHCETKRNGAAEHHFAAHTHTLEPEIANPKSQIQIAAGFAFTPAAERQLRVFATAGRYLPQPEWSENIPHPIEQSRGQTGSGDAYSPGWFEVPLRKGASASLIVTAEPAAGRVPISDFKLQAELASKPDSFEQQLLRAARAFVVRRGEGKTVIAGYPWFLDWGRDTFICVRGLLAAGMVEEVKQILLTFARFEKDGTLPNTIFGEDASNRDTSDAPLWFGITCEEAANSGQVSSRPGKTPDPLCDAPVNDSGRTVRDVLQSIATNYAKGTPNGIRMDPASGLIWSPSHFTWMDTNYPAASPREGYPVEIQALWIRLLRQLERLGTRAEAKEWSGLAGRALASFEKFFWLEERGYYADLLVAKVGEPAAQAVCDDALRSNCLFPISLGLVAGQRARRCVEAAARYLVVPGALRSLAPLPVSVPLPVYGHDGRLLNEPHAPYWGRYEGDEDTRRKPAYHNGTAWTWTFPGFCEALARAWDFSPEAVAAAKAYLGSMDRLIVESCLGQVPEILDGDAPHTQRGCDAQAWSATEALRVWKLLNAIG